MGINLGAGSGRNHCMGHETWDQASKRFQQHHWRYGLLPLSAAQSRIAQLDDAAKFLPGMVPSPGQIAS